MATWTETETATVTERQKPIAYSVPAGELVRNALAGALLALPLGMLGTLAVLIGWGWQPVALRILWLAVLVTAAVPIVRLLRMLWERNALAHAASCEPARLYLDTLKPSQVVEAAPKRPAPLFVGKVEPPRPALTFQSALEVEAQRQAKDDDHSREVATLARDMVEQADVRGLAIRRWAGRRTQSGVYVSQSLWREAVALLERAGAVEKSGQGQGYRLTADAAHVLADMGLQTLEAERRTGELVADGPRYARLVRV